MPSLQYFRGFYRKNVIRPRGVEGFATLANAELQPRQPISVSSVKSASTASLNAKSRDLRET
jgi:hypothetical protein